MIRRRCPSRTTLSTVFAGQIVLDEPTELPEGSEVAVVQLEQLAAFLDARHAPRGEARRAEGDAMMCSSGFKRHLC